MRTLPLVSATALAIAIMPGGAKASSFLSIAKPISILSNPIKVEPAKTGTIPVVSLGGGNAASIVLPLFDGKSGIGAVSNPIAQIIDQIIAKAPVASPTRSEPGAGSTAAANGQTANGKDCDPKTGKPIDTDHGAGNHGADSGHEGGKSGKDCDPKGDKGSHSDGAHDAGHSTGGKDCDPHQGKGGTGHGSTGHDGGNGGTATGGNGSGTAGGGIGNGGSSEIPPEGTPGNTNGNGDTNPGGDAGSGTLPGGGDIDNGDLPGGGSDDTGASGSGSGGMTGIGDSGAGTGNTGDSSAGTIPAGGIGDGSPPAGGDGSHIGGGGDQASAGAVPEPASWMTMIAGFGLVGAAMRAARKRGLILA